MRKSRLKALLTVAGFLLCAVHHAGAAVLVGYGFGTSAATYDPTFTAAGLENASAITTGAGFQGNVSGSPRSGISTSTGNPVNALFTRGPADASEAVAASNDRYFSLTLTPDSGTAMSLSSLTFDYFRDTSSSNSAYFIRTDAEGDNFTTTIASGTLSGNGQWLSRNADLSGEASLQNVTQAVSIRIYFYGSTGATADTRITRYDNLTVNGDLVVPEPAAGVLALAGVGAVLTGRRGGRP